MRKIIDPTKVVKMPIITSGMGGSDNANKGQHDRWVLLNKSKAEGFTHCIIGGKVPMEINKAIYLAYEGGGRKYLENQKKDLRWDIMERKHIARRSEYWKYIDAKIKKQKWVKKRIYTISKNRYSGVITNQEINGIACGPFFCSTKNEYFGNHYMLVDEATGRGIASFRTQKKAKRMAILLLEIWPQWETSLDKEISPDSLEVCRYAEHCVNNENFPWGWCPPDKDHPTSYFDPAIAIADQNMGHYYFRYKQHRSGTGHSSSYIYGNVKAIPVHRR